MTSSPEITIIFNESAEIHKRYKQRITYILTSILSEHLSTCGNQSPIEVEFTNLLYAKPNNIVSGFRVNVLNQGEHLFELNQRHWHGPWSFEDGSTLMAASKNTDPNTNLQIKHLGSEQFGKFYISDGAFFIAPFEIILLRGLSQK